MKAPSVFCSALNTKIKTQLSANICWFDLSLSHAVNFPLGNFPLYSGNTAPLVGCVRACSGWIGAGMEVCLLKN